MTVRELAIKCNVHYNTMRKWLIDNNVEKTSDAKNAQFIIDEDVIQCAMSKFNLESLEEDVHNNEDSFYKKIINDQREQIESLYKLLENQQILLLNEQKENESLRIEVSETKEEINKKKWWNRKSN